MTRSDALERAPDAFFRASIIIPDVPATVPRSQRPTVAKPAPTVGRSYRGMFETSSSSMGARAVGLELMARDMGTVSRVSSRLA